MTIIDEAPADQAPAKPKKPVKPAAIDHMSAFCKSDDPEVHLHCRGSGTNGVYDDHLWFCPCECHIDHPTCRDCGQRDVEITLTGTCVDTEGCQTSRLVRTASNEVHRQLRQIIDEAERREATEKARKAAERAAQREREQAQAQAEGRPIPTAPRAARTPKAPPTPQACHCGCGGMTKGGKFVAGHDAKLKGMLVRAARQTEVDMTQMTHNGGRTRRSTKSQAITAMSELIARDWPRKGVNTEVTRQADELFNQYGPDRIIEMAVAARYEGKSK